MRPRVFNAQMHKKWYFITAWRLSKITGKGRKMCLRWRLWNACLTGRNRFNPDVSCPFHAKICFSDPWFDKVKLHFGGKNHFVAITGAFSRWMNVKKVGCTRHLFFFYIALSCFTWLTDYRVCVCMCVCTCLILKENVSRSTIHNAAIWDKSV